MLKKYLTIIKTQIQRGITYRFTILAYRIGEIMEIIFLIFMWSAIYSEQDLIKGYTLPEMITYILVGNLITVFVRNFLADWIAREIKDGKLSLFLIKPIQYFRYIVCVELGRVTMPFIMSFISQIIVIFFFLDKIILNFDLRYLALILVMIILAFITELLISYLIGLVAFWTDEVSGLYLTISRIKKIFAGGYFPLSLLPAVFVNISLALPFAYSFFVPTQLYLKKLDFSTGLKGIVVQIVWIILLYGIIRLVWKRGLRKFEGVGI